MWSVQLHAQNLVPNPSFEEYWYCPNDISNLCHNTASTVAPSPKYWFDPNCLTSDYFNACSTWPSYTGVPQNAWGYQNPRTGNAYCGFSSRVVLINPSISGSECIGIKLDSVLVTGRQYEVGFWVSASDSFCTFTNNIGVLFDNDSNDYFLQFILNPNPQITFPQIIINDSGWINLKTVYTALGGEHFMYIGVFDSSGYVDSNKVGCTFAYTPPYSYNYIDDVSVTPISCSIDSLQTLPNVVTANGDGLNDRWEITACEGSEVFIYNRWGTCIHTNKGEYLFWQPKNEPDGVYYYILKHKKEQKTGFIQLMR
jgi:gliding motility-associated-like protein